MADQGTNIGNIDVRRLENVGMLMLQCDHSAPETVERLKEIFGVDLPGACQIHGKELLEIAWMSDDELLIILPHGHAAGLREEIETGLDGTFHMVADVSSARVVFEITGDGIRDVLAKETPANVSPEAFGPGDFRRTRYGQVAAAIWLRNPGTACLACRASESGYVETLLTASADPTRRPCYLAS